MEEESFVFEMKRNREKERKEMEEMVFLNLPTVHFCYTLKGRKSKPLKLYTSFLRH